MTKIRATYTATLADYYEADVYFRQGSEDRGLDKISQYFMFLLALIFVVIKSYFLAVVLLFLGIMFLKGWNKRFIVRLNFNRHVRDIGPETLIFSAEEIIYQRTGVDEVIDWDTYTHYLETPHLFVMIYASFQHYAVVPKSALTAAEVVALRELFVLKIGLSRDEEGALEL